MERLENLWPKFGEIFWSVVYNEGQQARSSAPVVVLQMSAFGMAEGANPIQSCSKVLAAVLIFACFFAISQTGHGRRLLVEPQSAFASQPGATILRVMLPFHLEFNWRTWLCSRFNSRMALQYVEAVRLAADLVQKSPLLGNMSVGFEIMDTCSSVDRVKLLLKAMDRYRRIGYPCLRPSLCPWWTPDPEHQTPPPEIKGLLELVIGIESSAVVKATESVFEWHGIPLISHAASRKPFSRRPLNLSTLTSPTEKSLMGQGIKRFVFSVFSESFEAEAILDLIAFFKWTHVGVFAPLTEEAMAMYSILQQNIYVNTRASFDIQVTYSTKDEGSVFDAAEKIANVPLINAVIFLGDLESSLPFIRAVSELSTTDRLVWIMTSTWGKQAWGLPLDNSKYQFVAKMKHVFFLQPVPAGKKSVLGVSWDSIAGKLQERLRNANRQLQENNQWFQKSMTAATSSFLEDEDRTQRSGMLGSGFGSEHPEDRAACTLRKHSFFLDNSLLLINAFLQAASSLDEIYKASINSNNCSRKYSDKECGKLSRALATRNGWFKLSESEKNRFKEVFGVDHRGLRENFHNGAARSNLTGFDLDPRNVKYSIYYMQRSVETPPFKARPSKFGHWTPLNGTQIRHSQLMDFEAEMANISSSCSYTCPPGTYQVATFPNSTGCCFKRCVPCAGSSFSNSSNSSKCTKCETGHLPSKDHTTCHIVFQRSSIVLVGAGIFTAVSFGMAALTLIQFYRHRCAFIVKSSDYTMSMGMLFFFSISFLSVALLLVEPSNFTCKSRVVAVLPWPVLYIGCILVKTNRLRVLVGHSSKLSAQKLPFLSKQTQRFFIGTLAFVTATFLFLWVALDSIEVHIVHYKEYSEQACSLSNTWMGVYFGGILSLLVTSLILASLTHGIHGDFNEASFLLLPTWTTFFWIILIPAYYVSPTMSVQSDTLLALIITSQGLVTMFCLFTRRLYYINRPMPEAEIETRRSFAQHSQCSNASSMPGQALALTRIQTIEHGIDLTTSTQHEERSHKMKPSASPAVIVIQAKPGEWNCALEVKNAKL